MMEWGGGGGGGGQEALIGEKYKKTCMFLCFM